MNTDISGRGWARTGLVLGGLVSVAANIAHSYIPPVGASTGWHPQTGAVAFAMGWPVFLFVAIEILARVQWRHGFWYLLLRFGGLIPVAGVAALVSYRHLSGLLAYYGEEPLVYHYGPLAIDGLMVMATTALLAIHTNSRPSTATPTPVIAPAISAVPANVPPPQAPAFVPPSAQVPDPPPPPTPAPTVSVASPPEQATRTLAVPTRAVSTAPTARPAPSTPDSSVARVHAALPPLPVPAATLARARHIAEAHHATTGDAITANELAVRAHIDTDKARQVLAVLDLDANRTTTIPAANGSPGTRR